MCNPICNPRPQDIVKKKLVAVSLNKLLHALKTEEIGSVLPITSQTHLQHTHGSHPSAPVASEFLPYWPQGQPPLHLKHRLSSLIARQFEVSRGMGFQFEKGHGVMCLCGIPVYLQCLCSVNCHLGLPQARETSLALDHVPNSQLQRKNPLQIRKSL